MLKIGTSNNTKNAEFSILNAGISRPDFLQFTIQQPTIFKWIRTGHKNVHVSLGSLMQRMSPLEKIVEKTIRTHRALNY